MPDRIDIAPRPDALARIGLTYLTPFVVATRSAVQALRL